jgi:hypothetical protein
LLIRPLVLLVTTGLGASLALAGPTAGASPTAYAPVTSPRARVVEVGGHERVAVTPVGSTGRTAVTPLATPGGSSGLFLTETSTGTTIQSAAGGAPTPVAGTAPRAERVAAAVDAVQLDFSAIARDGRDAPGHINVLNLATGALFTRELPADPEDTTCTSDSFARSDCLLVEPGDYSVMAFVTTMPAAWPSTESGRTVQNVALVGNPQAHVTGPQTFVLDARDADPVTVATPDHPTQTDQQGTMQLGYTRRASNGQGFSAAFRPSFMLDNHFYEQPTLYPVTQGSFSTLTRLRLEKPVLTLDAPHTRALHPAYYDAVWFSDVASDFPMYDGRARLRVVDLGQARPRDLGGRRLHGAIALVQRSFARSIAEQSNAAARAGASLVVVRNDGAGDNDDPNGTGVKLKVPTVRVDRAEGLSLARLPGKARVDVRGTPSSPYLYDLAIKERARIPFNLHYTYRTRDLSTQVREMYGQPTIGSTFSEAAYQYQPGDTFSISTMFPFRGGARARTEYRIPDPDTRWTYATTTPESRYNALFPDAPVEEMLLANPHTTSYAAHQSVTVPSGRAPVAAAPNPALPVQRSVDRMRIDLDGFTDADGNHGQAYSDVSGMATHLEIRADDTLVAETDNLPYGIAALPPGDARIAIELRTDNPQPWAQLSTHTDTTWSFPSSTTPSGLAVTEPLLLPSYDVPLDLRNRLAGGKNHRGAFHLGVSHPVGSSSAAIEALSLDASYDDGDTWKPATVTPSASGWNVVLPRGTGFVSLRLHAEDTVGSAVDQTLVRAFLVR